MTKKTKRKPKPRSALAIFNQCRAVIEAADPEACCEECGAGITAVQVPGDKLHAWIDHTSDCSHVHTGGVIVIDSAAVRANIPPADGILPSWAAAKASVEAQKGW